MRSENGKTWVEIELKSALSDLSFEHFFQAPQASARRVAVRQNSLDQDCIQAASLASLR